VIVLSLPLPLGLQRGEGRTLTTFWFIPGGFPSCIPLCVPHPFSFYEYASPVPKFFFHLLPLICFSTKPLRRLQRLMPFARV